MKNDSSSEAWDQILCDMRGLCEQFPDGIVVIGGAAIWLHTQQAMDKRLLQVSHDADFYMSIQDFGTLRDYEEITPNNRLGKHQMVKHGVDFDIYVENKNNLAVPYAEAQKDSVVLSGIRCASLEHLLVLKVRAFEDREHSAKGQKDAKDMAKILMLMSDNRAQATQPPSLRFLLREDIQRTKKVLANQEVFLDIAQNNAHTAKHLRERARMGFQYVETAYEHGHSSPDDHPGSGRSPRRNKGHEIGF